MNEFMNAERFGDDLISGRPLGVSRGMFLPIVLLGGVISTLATLVLVFVLSLFMETQFLSLMIWFVVPLGALLAGLLAGCGYTISCRVLQFFPSKGFLVLIFFLQFFMFFLGRYIEYLPVAILAEDPPGFVAYYRDSVENSEWSSGSTKNGQKEEPYTLGVLGYGGEVLIAAGFALASLGSLAILAAIPYCKYCSRFMRKKIHFEFPARAPLEKIGKKETEALAVYKERDDAALTRAMLTVNRIGEFLESPENGSRAAFVEFLENLKAEKQATAKELKKVLNSLSVHYSECADCDNYHLLVRMDVRDPQNKAAFQAVELMRYENGEFRLRVVYSENEGEKEA